MKNKIISLLMLFAAGCGTVRPVRTNFPPSTQQLTAVNISPYNISRSPEPSPITIREILGNDTARNAGAQSIFIYTPTIRNPVRPYVLGPWNGLCLNEPSLNHITTSLTQVARNIQNDEFLRLQTMSAHAQRDIAMLQSDFRLMREGYQAQLNERDIALAEAERSVQILRRNNFWSNVGFTAGGLLLGIGISGAFVLLSR